MGPLALMAIGAALGAAKSELSDRPRAERQRKRDAELARWSPWTAMGPQGIQEADLAGSMLRYGGTGLAFSNQLGGGGEEEAIDASPFNPDVPPSATAKPFDPATSARVSGVLGRPEGQSMGDFYASQAVNNPRFDTPVPPPGWSTMPQRTYGSSAAGPTMEMSGGYPGLYPLAGPEDPRMQNAWMLQPNPIMRY